MSIAFGTSVEGHFMAQIDGEAFAVPTHASLDAVLAEPRDAWLAVIDELVALHRDGELEPLHDVEPAMPFTVSDYVDFYSSEQHAAFFGRLLRPEGDPLLPNWKRMPVGYHGRASTVVVSGTPIRRPCGQTPEFSPTLALDIEIELGFVIGGPPNQLGEPIPIDHAQERIFGVVLLNDWSARDIQRFEGQPLGPFLSKAFATSISPWVIPIPSLQDARVPGPRQDPPPLAHLATGEHWNFDIDLELEINGDVASTTNARDLYWSPAQQLTHLASGGAIVRPGDLLGTGTISGDGPEHGGSLMEIGHPFLSDGDEVVIRGHAGALDVGEVQGTVAPA